MYELIVPLLSEQIILEEPVSLKKQPRSFENRCQSEEKPSEEPKNYQKNLNILKNHPAL